MDADGATGASRSARSASCTSPTGSSSTGRCCSASRSTLRVRARRARAAPARARRSTRLRGARRRRARVGGRLDDAQARRRAATRAARAPELEPPPVDAQWRLPGDLGRRYAAVSGDRNPIHMHALPPRRSASRARSRTGCGRRRAAWRRCGCRTRSRSTCGSGSRSCCPSTVTFGEADDRFAVHGHLEGTCTAVEPVMGMPIGVEVRGDADLDPRVRVAALGRRDLQPLRRRGSSDDPLVDEVLERCEALRRATRGVLRRARDRPARSARAT